MLDLFRLWPDWWEGEPPRDYYLVELGETTLLLYQTIEGWFSAKIFD